MDKKEESWTRKLSDMYINQMNEPELELKVQVMNINYGSNMKLMEAFRTLKEYSQFVVQVRKYAETEDFSEAVEHAVEKCINNGISVEVNNKYCEFIVTQKTYKQYATLP